MEKTRKIILFFFITLLLNMQWSSAQSSEEDRPEVLVKRVSDFEITGDGSSSTWEEVEWSGLKERIGKSGWSTRMKTVYSDSGIYFLFSCEDKLITATFDKDNEKLWTEDVVEVFLWTDEQYPVYFEYELSPLNFELPLLISRMNGTHKNWGWIPWQYQERKIQHLTSTQGGKKESGSKISSWTAEIFIPFDLLTHFSNTPPKSGTKWRANMYRVDYDKGAIKEWSWSVFKTNFHDYENFGTLSFE